MANMALGAYTFLQNPSRIPQQIHAEKATSAIKTMDGVATFSWDSTVKGVRISLSWDLMSTAQYASILALYLAGGELVFDPQDGSSLTFDVVILGFNGAYFMALENASGNHRQNVELTFVITAQN